MRRRRTTAAVVLLAAALVGSAVALPLLGGSAGRVGAGGEQTATAADTPAALERAIAQNGSQAAADAEFELVTFDQETAADGGAEQTVQETNETAVEVGVTEGVELVQSQGIDVTQEQRAAALEGARAAVTQYQTVEAEQVQAATAGAVHGALIQKQSVNATQIQHAVAGATGGGLSQAQTVNATQLQSATWGAAHGGLAQSQRVTGEQIQVATRGAAAGAAKEAGAKDVGKVPTIQEAAQGSAYGVLTQYQSIAVEQRQRVTIEHVQHAAAGAAAGAIDGATRANVSQAQRVDVRQEQRVAVEQRQRVTIKQVQKAAAGAAKGALVQKQQVSVRQTQAAARGASRGSLKQVQSIRIEQYQRISITQIQEASFGAAKGAISQSQAATVRQIHAAATGSASGVLVQRQVVSITQIQYAAVGAAEGAISSAVQQQSVTVEQIQAAAFGAGEGAVTQTQLVEITQVQYLARGGASGALTQVQTATVEQIQTAARLATRETADAVQTQRISVTQLQRVTAETAADATAYAVQEGTDDVTVISQRVEVTVVQRIETVDRLEGTATIDFADQTADGQRVTIEEVSLSEGGFVAVYGDVAVDADPDSVIGVSSYLEAGTHENVTIELDEPLAESGAVVAVAHHDTNRDEAFDYVDSDGETDPPYVTGAGAPALGGAFVTVAEAPDEPTGSLSVADQTGNGSSLTVAEANASVPYAVTATYDGETVESETFAAGEPVTNRSLELEPPLSENATVSVSVVDEDGSTLANETIEYTVAAGPDGPTEPDEGPNASLSVSNQTGNGSSLTVDEANATVDYALTVTDENDTQLAATEPIAADETVENEMLELEPPLAENATLEVAVVAAADGATLANETIAYTVADEGPEGPEGSLSVDNQTGDGETLAVDAASASVPYVISAEYDGRRVDSEVFEANTTVTDETLELEPPIEANTTVDVSVRAAADDTELANETITYGLAEPDPDRPTANLSVADQTGDGETITVTQANASVDYAITVTDENGTQRTATETFGANETIGPLEFTLEPPLESNATLEVAVVDAGNGTVLETDAVEYTVDGTLEAFDVEFVNCTYVEVDASLDEGERVAASTSFYTSSGIGDTIAEDIVTAGDEMEAPFDGTIVFRIGDERDVTTDGDRVIVEVPDYGTFGTYISGISSPEAAPVGGIDYPNPDETCLDSIRPDRPSLSVVETAPTEDGIDVTFGYENPNDAPLAANSEFVEGTTTAQPPTELEPGQQEFTVEWTPESDDERLVWQVDLSQFGYEEPLTAATPPAGELEADPAAFGVSITGTNDPVTQGEPILVEAQVENVGGETGTQNVSLAIGDAVVNATAVSLEAGETGTVSLAADSANLAPGEYPVAVSTANETAETTVTVEPRPDPAAFAVADLSAPETGTPGEEVTVSATIENEGDLEGTKTATYSIDGQPIAEASVTLAGGQATTLSFSPQLPAGTSTHTVATPDDQASVTIEAAVPGADEGGRTRTA